MKEIITRSQKTGVHFIQFIIKNYRANSVLSRINRRSGVLDAYFPFSQGLRVKSSKLASSDSMYDARDCSRSRVARTIIGEERAHVLVQSRLF